MEINLKTHFNSTDFFIYKITKPTLTRQVRTTLPYLLHMGILYHTVDVVIESNITHKQLFTFVWKCTQTVILIKSRDPFFFLVWNLILRLVIHVKTWHAFEHFIQLYISLINIAVKCFERWNPISLNLLVLFKLKIFAQTRDAGTGELACQTVNIQKKKEIFFLCYIMLKCLEFALLFGFSLCSVLYHSCIFFTFRFSPGLCISLIFCFLILCNLVTLIVFLVF